MSEGGSVADLTYELLKRMSARFDKFEIELGDIKSRIIVLEEGLASMSARIATVEVSTAQVIKRMDRIEHRLDRIERRLDLVDAH